jgi:hypothetical protein
MCVGAAAPRRRGSSAGARPGKSGLVGNAATSVFVDRELEFAMLQAAFEAATAGQPQTVVIEGEAGIGKTTLVERLVGQLPGVRLLRASGDEGEAHVPFAMADQLLRGAALTTNALQAGHHVPVGMELLELMTSGSGDTPTVIIIDEGHLADAESLRALLFAARRLAGSRVLLLLVVRGVAQDTLPEGWRKLAAPPMALCQRSVRRWAS